MNGNERRDDAEHAIPGLTRRGAVVTLASMLFMPLPIVSARGATVTRHRSPDETPLHYSSLAEVARLIETRQLSPVDLTRLMLDRIASVDRSLQSYVTIMADAAMSSARRAEAEIRAGRYRGPLHGMPIAIKDLCYTRGIRTMAGTKVLEDFKPDFNATVVDRLESAGAVILGKLALCEGAFAPYYPGLQVPVNPWDETRWSGLSSSGSGVATAAGLCFASVGTDTGGSIRYPSAANGCVGLKPTYGRVSRHGVFGLAESMDHLGPMTRTVEDAAIMFEAMAGFDQNDATSLADPVPKVREQLARGISGLRLGIDRGYVSDNVEPAVAKGVDDALSTLTSLGATVVEVKMPDVREVPAAWFELCTVEAVLANSMTWPSRSSDYGPGFRAALEYGSKVGGASYARAARFRAEFSAKLERMLAGVDCMVCPSMAAVARPKSADPFAPGTAAEWSRLVMSDVHTKPFNLSGSPTLSVPCGFAADGLPLSVQFVGRRLSEATLCRVGHAYEQATRWHSMHPGV